MYSTRREGSEEALDVLRHTPCSRTTCTIEHTGILVRRNGLHETIMKSKDTIFRLLMNSSQFFYTVLVECERRTKYSLFLLRSIFVAGIL